MEYLDFELPIKELEEQLDKCVVIGQESDVDVTNTCKQINKKLEETKKKKEKSEEVLNALRKQINQKRELAGIFHSDCDNELNDHILRFDNNNYGHLILQ